ncbi:MAG: hypothetical protein J6D47_08605 [Peptostreptococcaceae bacterium]|nr:hypothetical protein [Peptostreptococcaceae bacterium]
MILDDKVVVSWNNATSKWYIDKGYTFTKNKDLFLVKSEDIIKTSTIRVNVSCDYCGKVHSKEYRKYIKGRNVIEKDCCDDKKCLAAKTKEINLKLYGVEYSMQRSDIKEKVSSTNRTPYEEVLSLCNKKGLIMISNPDKYKNKKSELKIICNKHIDKGVQTTNFANIKKGKHCCFYGGAEEVGISKRLDFNIVVDKFLELGLTPLFNKKDYKGNSSKLKFICEKHKDKGVQLTTYAIIQQGSCGCNYCSRDVAINKLRLDQDFIFSEFKRKGLKVISGQTYKHKDQHIKYICLKHPNVEQYSTYNNLKRTNQPCNICRNEECLSDINKRLRSSISKWKKNTEEYNNYKCIFTNSNIYDVHHIYPYNEIIKESLENLKINPNSINGMDIENLKKEVVRLHDYYGLGVCIHPKIHSLFHVIYGKNSTIENFEEFKTNYINGTYGDLNIR